MGDDPDPFANATSFTIPAPNFSYPASEQILHDPHVFFPSLTVIRIPRQRLLPRREPRRVQRHAPGVRRRDPSA